MKIKAQQEMLLDVPAAVEESVPLAGIKGQSAVSEVKADARRASSSIKRARRVFGKHASSTFTIPYSLVTFCLPIKRCTWPVVPSETGVTGGPTRPDVCVPLPARSAASLGTVPSLC